MITFIFGYCILIITWNQEEILGPTLPFANPCLELDVLPFMTFAGILTKFMHSAEMPKFFPKVSDCRTAESQMSALFSNANSEWFFSFRPSQGYLENIWRMDESLWVLKSLRIGYSYEDKWGLLSHFLHYDICPFSLKNNVLVSSLIGVKPDQGSLCGS